MKFDSKNIISKLEPVSIFAKKYTAFILTIVMLIIVGFLVFRINQYSSSKPSEDAVSEKLKTVQRPRIDKAVLDKIENLQDQNVQVQSLFEQARNNPFSE